jgi:hypothetical protein
MDAAWLIGAYLLGSLSVHFMGLIDFSLLKSQNNEVIAENIKLRALLNEMKENIEGQARKLAVNVLSNIVEVLKETEKVKKETK